MEPLVQGAAFTAHASPQLLRKAEEPEQKPLIPVDRPDRRLQDSQLIEAIRHASGDAIRLASKPINGGCGTELLNACAEHTKVAQLVRQTTNSDFHSPLMVEALRGAHLCLATNYGSLSPECVATLMKEFLKSASSSHGNTEPPRKEDHLMHGNDHASAPRIRRHADAPGEEDSSEDHVTGNGDLIYGASNNEVALFSPPENAALGHQSHPNRHQRHRHHDDHDSLHPLVWVVILPFFCVGVAVSIKRGLAMYRQRRNGASPSYEYVPLSAHEASS